VDGLKRVTMKQNEASFSETIALLDRMKSNAPELLDQAQVVGRWVWLEFNVAPEPQVRGKLKELGFHWNGVRKCWQHPCGDSRPRSAKDPRAFFTVQPASGVQLQETSVRSWSTQPKEYKVVCVRECPVPDTLQICDTDEKAADYWRQSITTNPYFNPECECFVVLLLNTRRRVKGHQLITIGTLDTILVHPREVFRVAILMASAAIVLMHNHPSGDSSPSEADIKVTRDLIRAGQLLKIEVLDHVIMGNPKHSSLRALGYFYS
jgi:hypothetical protein